MTRMLRSFIPVTVMLTLMASGCLEGDPTQEDSLETTGSALTNSGFAGWSVVDGTQTFSFGAAVTAQALGVTDLYAVRASDKQMMVASFRSGTLFPWAGIGGVFNSKPAVTHFSNNSGSRETVVALGTDNRIWQSSLTGATGHFSPWTAIGTNTFTSPPAISFVSPYLVVCARKSDNAFYCARNIATPVLDESAWTSFAIIPNGTFTSEPAATSNLTQSQMTIAGRGFDNRFYFATTTDGTTWVGNWTAIPNGTFTSGPALSGRTGSVFDIFGRGGDNFVWQKTSTDSGFQQVPNGTFNSGPGAWAEDQNHVDVIALGMDNKAYVNFWHQ